MDEAASSPSAALATATGSADPEVGLRAVAALRGLVETLETLQVDNARAKGWSWQDIAGRLGVTKQAVHQKHGPAAGRAKGRDHDGAVHRHGRPPAELDRSEG
jgi:hypothetical protein